MIDHYDVGDLIHFSSEFTTGSALVDPDMVQFSIKAPDGVMSTFVYPDTIQKAQTGSYFVDYYLSMEGQYFVRWFCSGTFISAEEESIIVDLGHITRK